MVDEARRKMQQKNCDMVVGNVVSAAGTGFESDDNEVVMVTRTGDTMADAVLWASRSLPTKTTAPLLTGLHIVADRTGLVLSGSDADVSARANVEADVADLGRDLEPRS